MKGLLKGLRYISDIFEQEKEQEMQIGNPTDVKHVAHIGMDGPSANKPSWMNEFNSAEELSSDTLANNLQETPSSAENGTAVESSKVSEKGSRGHRSSNNSMGSPARESSSQGRRHSNRSSNGSESPSQDLPDIPKKSRRKKSKASSGGSDGSSISSRTKEGSLPDVTELES
ncbi:CRIB domain-containing protein RIC7-like isoform X1 [Gossypium australe]|uniref:CRIB domain-containing protein RIC7-like isoform X1 n=1 Tax=Gossypium australe TaxID=47621 RepID=A0A5B6VFM6_9ROSI|nr:CRIB domain-containing protein RIC7-like isoform X1 [Gossypium australe]